MPSDRPALPFRRCGHGSRSPSLRSVFVQIHTTDISTTCMGTTSGDIRFLRHYGKPLHRNVAGWRPPLLNTSTEFFLFRTSPFLEARTCLEVQFASSMLLHAKLVPSVQHFAPGVRRLVLLRDVGRCSIIDLVCWIFRWINRLGIL